MCNRVAVPPLPVVEETFNARVENPELYKEYYHVNTWDKPKLPTLHSDNLKIIKLDEWATKEEGFDTYNARNDKIFNNLHKERIFTNRVIVIVAGFFEYRAVGNKKYPYFIKLKNGKPFAMGGLINRFGKLSIITTEANETMKFIHNQAKRMPLILTQETQYKWLEKDLMKQEIEDLMVPAPDELMTYYTIDKIPQKPDKNNVPQTICEFQYPELDNELFK